LKNAEYRISLNGARPKPDERESTRPSVSKHLHRRALAPQDERTDDQDVVDEEHGLLGQRRGEQADQIWWPRQHDLEDLEYGT
jgi:hypothetical protein